MNALQLHEALSEAYSNNDTELCKELLPLYNLLVERSEGVYQKLKWSTNGLLIPDYN